MLLNDFYTITGKSQLENKWEFQIELNASHHIYEGHFPEVSIVPGVCTLQIIRECAEEITGCRLRMPQLSSCKFLSVVNPKEGSLLKLSISLDENPENNTYQLRAEGVHREQGFIKVKATLTKAIV